MKDIAPITASLVLLLISANSSAQDSLDSCLRNIYETGDNHLTLQQIKNLCKKTEVALGPIEHKHEQSAVKQKKSTGLISTRIMQEQKTEFQPFVITPHKLNYLMPALSTNSTNDMVNENIANELRDSLVEVEAKFQLSLKIPLNSDDILLKGDRLYVGFTLQAWWQIYSSGISKPFRETNYQPEIFYYTPLKWQPFGGNTGVVLGVEHQSNGRSQLFSRSWNRVYANFVYEKDDYAIYFRPWLRLSESEKAFPLAPKGDDNPDIQDFMGNFELGFAYLYKDVEFTYEGRQNFSTGNGSAEFGATFPLFGKVHGYVTLFTGYGESLIDYNYNQTRMGFGVALNRAF